MSAETQHHAEEHEHPGEAVYIRVAVILAIITGVEVVLSYVKIGDSQVVTNGGLLILAAVKFTMVAMYFMHLKFDNPILRRLFVTGLLLAIARVHRLPAHPPHVHRLMPSPWAWHAHPSVWAVIGLVAGGYAAAAAICSGRGSSGRTRRQVATFYAGVLLDVGRGRLAGARPGRALPVQRAHGAAHHADAGRPAPAPRGHACVAAAAGCCDRDRPVGRCASGSARPLPAAVIYNVVFVFTHWPPVVDSALQSEVVHFGVHCLIFFTALNMWFPVMNRLPEFPMMSPPARMLYLFLQSVIPTVPASFLTFADGVIYKFYATVSRTRSTCRRWPISSWRAR